MNLEEVKKFLSENQDSQEVKDFVQTLNPVKADNLKELIKTDTTAKSWFDSEKDKHAGAHLETWKKNNLSKLVEEEVAKRNPAETPEQKKIRELEEKINKQSQEAQLSALKEAALKHATANGLPPKFATKYIDKFLGDDEKVTTSTLDELKADLDEAISAGVEERFKQNGRGFGSGAGGNDKAGSFGKEMAESLKQESGSQEGLKTYFGE